MPLEVAQRADLLAPMLLHVAHAPHICVHIHQHLELMQVNCELRCGFAICLHHVWVQWARGIMFRLAVVIMVVQQGQEGAHKRHYIVIEASLRDTVTA